MFTLDDVRESFTSDVTRFLSEVDKGARAVASAAKLAMPSERAWRVPVDGVVVGLHGIVGSSSLIGLDNLMVPARELEQLALTAVDSIRVIKHHLARLQRIADLGLAGGADLRVILEHELAGKGADAGTRRAALEVKIEAAKRELAAMQAEEASESGETDTGATVRAVKLPPLPAAPRRPEPARPEPARTALAVPEDDGWDTAVTAAGPAAPVEAGAPAGAVDPELAEVFQGEAREALTNLRGYLARLEQQPGDRDAWAQCARLLHLLKGAAASVQLVAIAEQARALHAVAEQARGGRGDAATVARVRAGLEALVRAAVPDLASAPEAAGPVPPPVAVEAPAAEEDSEPRALFFEEARHAMEEVKLLLRQIVEATGTARGVVASRVERVLHRLKGSALIVGEPQLAAVAGRGQALCAALDKVDPAALGGVVAQLDGLVGGTPVARPAPSDRATVAIQLPPKEEWEVYLEESSELLDELDRVLATVESSKRPASELTTIFRAFHTLKGATNSVGLGPIGQQLHILETFLERQVSGAEPRDLRGMVTVLSEQAAGIRRNIARAGAERTVVVDHARLTAQLAALGQGASSGASWINPADSAWSAGTGSEAGSAADSQADDSQASHASRGDGSAARGDESSRAADAGSRSGAERKYIRVPAERLDSLLDLAGELVVCRARMLSHVGRLQALYDDDETRQHKIVSVIDGFASSTEFANLDGRRLRQPRATAASALGFGLLELDQYEDIHILSRRLDEAAGDVVEIRREMGQEMESLSDDAETLGTIVSTLQSEITRARMLTLELLLNRLRLPIRDAAQRSAREVEIVTSGEHLAIDKAMSDALYAPLLHLVRNAVVHGIEAPEVRQGLGKPRQGTVAMVARQEHGQIVLEVSDDGAGIDTRRLRQIGVERGLLPADVAESDPRVVDLIFAKGVSTSATVDDVAGRGIGGNVLRRAIDRLNGSIEISTERGRGTTFRLTLPLSMSITQAILVRVGGALLAVPVAFSETILARDGVDLVDSFGRLRARIDGRLVPVHRTADLFSPGTLRSTPTGAILVVCMVGAERIAILVDEVVGREEIVVKSLSALLEGHPLFSGSTSRGDGELALILDVPGVLAHETTGERRATVATVVPVVGRGAAAPAAAPVEAPLEESFQSSAAPALAPAFEVAEVVPIQPARHRILFVDDSISVRKVAERILASLDVDVVTAVDGLDALEKLRSMAFSLVFTDLEMPRMHGYELLREMQMIPAYRDTPVVVISSRSGQKHIDQALQTGAREYLTKPFTAEILGAVIGRLARGGGTP